jgi:uncharacterized protein (TIGR03435 family)
MTMARLASELSFVGRQVIDRTGLAGAYDVELEWTPDSPAVAVVCVSDSFGEASPKRATKLRREGGGVGC